MNQRETFERDLKLGKPAELAVLAILKQEFPDCVVELIDDLSSQKNDGDIRLTTPAGRVYFFEVKNDFKAAETGNLTIEISNVNRKTFRTSDGWLPKGAGKDHLFVFVVPEGPSGGFKMLFFEKQALRNLYARNMGWKALVPTNRNPDYVTYNYHPPSGLMIDSVNGQKSEVFYPSGLQDAYEFRSTGLVFGKKE